MRTAYFWLPRWLRSPSPWRVVALAALLVILLAYIDWATGPDFSLSVFYLIPVGLIAWFLGRAPGILATLLCVVLWFAIDYQEERSLLAFRLYWETLSPIPMFLLFVWVTCTCRRLFQQVERLIEARTAGLKTELEARNHADQARIQLAAEVSAAEEAERRRLAQDLHDSFGQELAALKMILHRNAELAPPHCRDRIAMATDVVERLIAQARDMSFDLYPAALDRFGLVAALRLHAEQVAKRTGVNVSVSETADSAPLDLRLNTILFRIIRELIHNAVKHGPARHVLVRFRWHDGTLRVVIDDDGRGFPPHIMEQVESQTGIGLRWIRERLTLLGGELILESLPGSGARAILCIPLQPLARPLPACAEAI